MGAQVGALVAKARALVAQVGAVVAQDTALVAQGEALMSHVATLVAHVATLVAHVASLLAWVAALVVLVAVPATLVRSTCASGLLLKCSKLRILSVDCLLKVGSRVAALSADSGLKKTQILAPKSVANMRRSSVALTVRPKIALASVFFDV